MVMAVQVFVGLNVEMVFWKVEKSVMMGILLVVMVVRVFVLMKVLRGVVVAVVDEVEKLGCFGRFVGMELLSKLSSVMMEIK